MFVICSVVWGEWEGLGVGWLDDWMSGWVDDWMDPRGWKDSDGLRVGMDHIWPFGAVGVCWPDWRRRPVDWIMHCNHPLLIHRRASSRDHVPLSNCKKIPNSQTEIFQIFILFFLCLFFFGLFCGVVSAKSRFYKVFYNRQQLTWVLLWCPLNYGAGHYICSLTTHPIILYLLVSHIIHLPFRQLTFPCIHCNGWRKGFFIYLQKNSTYYILFWCRSAFPLTWTDDKIVK